LTLYRGINNKFNKKMPLGIRRLFRWKTVILRIFTELEPLYSMS